MYNYIGFIVGTFKFYLFKGSCVVISMPLLNLSFGSLLALRALSSYAILLLVNFLSI